MRAFIGIRLDEAIDSISLIIKDLKLKDKYANYTSLKNIHITLEFLGEIDKDDIPIIEEIFSTISRKSFEILLDGVTKLRDMIIIRVSENEELIALQADLKKTLKNNNITTQDREYFPHVTLARKSSLRVDLDYRKRVKINEIILFSSKRINDNLVHTPILTKKLI